MDMGELVYTQVARGNAQCSVKDLAKIDRISEHSTSTSISMQIKENL